jgi:glycosyltransferase involved in cell wall biosynthesis
VNVSVVIPTFNGAGTLGEQLDALARQDWQGPLEVVVSDNGSTDDTRAVVQSFAERFSSLTLVDSSDVPGAAHARNVGVSAAKGDYLLFCDADDTVGEGWLKAMAAALDRHPVVAARLEYRRLNPAWTRDIYGDPQHDELLAPPSFLPFAFGGSLGVRRDVHINVGGFDPEYPTGEDVDYSYRIQLSGTPIHFVPAAVVHVRVRQRPGEIFRQFRAYGREWATLLKQYSSYGMQRPSQLRALASWLLLALSLPLYLPTREHRTVWVSRLAWKVGRLEGSVRGRLLAL